MHYVTFPTYITADMNRYKLKVTASTMKPDLGQKAQLGLKHETPGLN